MTSINYDVTVSESTSVLSTLLQVRAVDSDDANTPNGQIRYSIVSPAAALSFFTIDSISGNITSRLSLVSVPEDIYTVSTEVKQHLEPNSDFFFCFSRTSNHL